MKLVVLAAIACGPLLLSQAVASRDSGDESSGPLCTGRELGITQRTVAVELAAYFCSCASTDPEYLATCTPDVAEQLCLGDCTTILCGGQLTLLEQCYEVVQGCNFGIPDYCWELLGWNFEVAVP